MQTKQLSHWTAVKFCVFLSVLALVGTVTEQMWVHVGGWWKPAFFAFLPMCFVYLAYTTSNMQDEINELRSRLEASQPPREPLTQR